MESMDPYFHDCIKNECIKPLEENSKRRIFYTWNLLDLYFTNL